MFKSPTLQGQLVYANYGRDEDFVTLENMGIPVKGKIVLMRYGKTSRAAKVIQGFSVI